MPTVGHGSFAGGSHGGMLVYKLAVDHDKKWDMQRGSALPD